MEFSVISSIHVGYLHSTKLSRHSANWSISEKLLFSSWYVFFASSYMKGLLQRTRRIVGALLVIVMHRSVRTMYILSRPNLFNFDFWRRLRSPQMSHNR